jgi:NAD(P)H dehydrogenase (quinone)
MKNPTPRMQMIDGFNEGWIDFKNHGAAARKGRVTIDEAITALVAVKEKGHI